MASCTSFRPQLAHLNADLRQGGEEGTGVLARLLEVVIRGRAVTGKVVPRHPVIDEALARTAAFDVVRQQPRLFSAQPADAVFHGLGAISAALDLAVHRDRQAGALSAADEGGAVGRDPAAGGAGGRGGRAVGGLLAHGSGSSGGEGGPGGSQRSGSHTGTSTATSSR